MICISSSTWLVDRLPSVVLLAAFPKYKWRVDWCYRHCMTRLARRPLIVLFLYNQRDSPRSGLNRSTWCEPVASPGYICWGGLAVSYIFLAVAWHFDIISLLRFFILNIQQRYLPAYLQLSKRKSKTVQFFDLYFAWLFANEFTSFSMSSRLARSWLMQIVAMSLVRSSELLLRRAVFVSFKHEKLRSHWADVTGNVMLMQASLYRSMSTSWYGRKSWVNSIGVVTDSPFDFLRSIIRFTWCSSVVKFFSVTP